MNNDEIKALLRELKERSDRDGEVKSQTVRISFGEEEPEKPVKPKKSKPGLFSGKRAGRVKGKDKTEDRREENAGEEPRERDFPGRES